MNKTTRRGLSPLILLAVLLSACSNPFFTTLLGLDEKPGPEPSTAHYTVTFDAGGGSSAAQTKTVPSGASIGAENMPSAPTRAGYDFGGWYTAQNGGGAEFTASTTVTGALTVYAKWTPGALVSVTLQPQPVDPPLSNTTVFTDTSALFSAAGKLRTVGSGNHRWGSKTVGPVPGYR